MKIVTQKELDGHDAATLRGALEGTVAGLAVAIPGSFILHRRWAYYRSLPLSLKVTGIVLFWGPIFAIQAERRGVEYDKAQWTGAGKLEMDREQDASETRWRSLSPGQKLGDWAGRNKYTLLFGCWAASMAGSWMLISRGNTTQSFSQKIVQARVYAQGITVASVIGAAMLTHSQRKDLFTARGAEQSQRVPADHSWAKLVSGVIIHVVANLMWADLQA